MRSAIVLILACLALMAGHVALLTQAAQERDALPVNERYAAFVPGSIVKISALEFDGLISDLFFLRALVFIGSTYERQETPRVQDWEWEWLYNQLDVATELDGYFLDPYYVAQANLAVGARRFDLANRLLEKAHTHRDWDWLPFFFAGFNRFYYQDDAAGAIPYLEAAARLPKVSLIVKSLALRAAYKGNRNVMAIMFLEEMLAMAEQEYEIRDLQRRLDGFRSLLFLEKAVEKYRTEVGEDPDSIDSLINAGIIRALPYDYYGGTYYIDSDGNVRTTSDLM